MEPQTRGDPMSPLKWTTKSTRNLSEALAGRGHQVSASTRCILPTGELGYSLQGNAKTIEGKQHPDRVLPGIQNDHDPVTFGEDDQR